MVISSVLEVCFRLLAVREELYLLVKKSAFCPRIEVLLLFLLRFLQSKRQGHKVTYHIIRQNTLTRLWMIISTSNLVGIIDVGSIRVYFLG